MNEQKTKAHLVIYAEFDLEDGTDVADIKMCVEDAVDNIRCIGNITKAELNVPSHTVKFK